MSGISTHILDTSLGRPAASVALTLERHDAGQWLPCATALTDPDGRSANLLAPAEVKAGVYRLTFQTGAYFHRLAQPTLYPQIAITFRVERDGERYHIPLLVSPFGYSTYRGS